MSKDIYRDDSISIIEFCSGYCDSSIQIGTSSGYVKLDEERALIVAEALADWIKERLDKKRVELNERIKKNISLRMRLHDTSIKTNNIKSDLIGE